MIDGLTACFAGLADPRATRRCDHRLIDILVIAVCAVIACAESWGFMPPTWGDHTGLHQSRINGSYCFRKTRPQFEASITPKRKPVTFSTSPLSKSFHTPSTENGSVTNWS